MRNARDVNMDSVISIASSVIQCLYDDTQNDSDVLHWIENFNNFETAISKWSKPQRKTLLHEYIQDQYLDAQNYVLDKHFVVDEIKGMQNLLEHYGVDYSYIGKVNVANLPFDEYTEELGEYADKLQSFFIDNLLYIVVDDVFSILYMNKNFLHEFNRQCAEIIRTLKKDDYPDLLRDDGVIKRVSYYPTWLKRGIEYRDKCRCSICGCDLSSAFTTLVDKNYDHIIPLKMGGNNDPSNWQLTCERCNKSKGARSSDFKNIVFPFWEIKDGD